MGSDQHLVQVEIFGQSYNLRGDAEPGYINELAEFVDRKMREVSNAAASVDSMKIAILAALNIADETRRQIREKDLRDEEANGKMETLITALDRCLAPDRKEGRSPSSGATAPRPAGY